MQTLRVPSNPFDKIVQSLVALFLFRRKANIGRDMQRITSRPWQFARKSFDAGIDLFKHYTSLDLILERLNSRVLDRILLGTQLQAQIHGGTFTILFGMTDVCACLAGPLLKKPHNGVARLAFIVWDVRRRCSPQFFFLPTSSQSMTFLRSSNRIWNDRRGLQHGPSGTQANPGQARRGQFLWYRWYLTFDSRLAGLLRSCRHSRLPLLPLGRQGDRTGDVDGENTVRRPSRTHAFMLG